MHQRPNRTKRPNRPRRRDVPTVILYLADYDPSGQLAAHSTRDRILDLLKKLGSKWGNIESILGFDILALTPEQISAWNLPTRPTKDSNHKGDHHEGDSVELDAIPPRTFETLITDRLELFMPQAHRDAVEELASQDRARMNSIVDELEAAGLL